MLNYIKRLYYEVGKYENLAKTPTRVPKARRKVTEDLIRKHLKMQQIEEILEIGTGSGYITEVISKVIKEENCNLSIMDFSESFLETTRQLNIKLKNVYLNDIQDIDTALPQKFDLVVFQEILEHLVSPFIAMQNINKFLNNNGIVVVSIPNSFYWRYFLSFIKSIIIGKKKSIKDTHITELSPYGFIKLASMAGFQIEQIFCYPCFYKGGLSILMGQEVLFLIRKVDEPENCWKDLQDSIVHQWK